MSFLNAALLFGLAAVLIPPVVHLFNRRRPDEVDWAAMQFLRLTPNVRRKVTWEHVLLMLLRMAVLAALAVGLAAPTVRTSLLGRMTGGDRDIVLVIDGSASMAYKPPSPAVDAAREWADDFLDSLGSGDRVAIVQARQKPVTILGTLTADHAQARNALELLAPPGGTADWPAALQTAVGLLDGGRPDRHVVVVSDGQRYGWADETTLSRWDLFRRTTDRDGPTAPRIWVVNVAPDRPADPANWSLDPITAGRAVAAANREVTFRSALRYTGGDPPAPGKVKLSVDGRPAGEVKADGSGAAVPLRFTQKFPAGSHVVTLQLDPDDLPADNRQDFALEVLPAVPVLIVDGDLSPSAADRRSDFLRDALAPAKDPAPGFAVRTVSVSEFKPAVLAEDVRGPGTPPRVLVLANVERLTSEQQQAVEKYLSDGGSVLVTLGDRVDPAAWNRVAFRGGQGFLPARVVEQVSGPATPDPASFTHPATDVFRDPLPGGLHTAVFPRRWKLDPAAGVNGVTGTTIARLTTGEPFLVERGFGTGRVVASAVPLDTSWGTNLPRLPDFVRLAHELTYYLAGARGADRNLDPAQPIVFAPKPDEPPGPVTLVGPDGRSRSQVATAWPAVFPGPHDPGSYRLTTPAGRTVVYAVRPDPREAVLTPASEDDRRKVAEAVGKLTDISSPDEVSSSGADGLPERELWGLMMTLVLGLLGLELWYTRRLATRGNGPST
jgi:hypothetical protein